MFNTTNAKKLEEYDTSSIILALKEKKHRLQFSDQKNPVRQEITQLFEKATEEMSTHPDVILSLDKMKITKCHDWEGSGEIYVLSYALDNTGLTEYRSPLFQGIKDGDSLPLGPGGMLIHYKKKPGLFLDLHGIVMESDSDIRELGKRIQEAKDIVKLDEITKMATALSSFDPTRISLIITGVNMFLDALVFVMQKNNDDHIGTFHDFYLKQQAFGVGRHPKKGLKRCQDVELAYRISFAKE